MKCLICDKDSGKGKTCSSKCRKTHSRMAKCDTISVTNPKCDQSVTEPAILNNIDPTKAIVHTLSASDLYNAISHYLANAWVASPEFGELMRRLRVKSVEELKSEGYWIPSWKYKEVV